MAGRLNPPPSPLKSGIFDKGEEVNWLRKQARNLKYLDSKRVGFGLLRYVKGIFQQPAGAFTRS